MGTVADVLRGCAVVVAEAGENTFTAAELDMSTNIGAMKGDIPAMGPFPAVAMSDVDAAMAAKPIILPWETGTYTFEGDKISSVVYSGDPPPQDLDGDATTMHLEPPTGFPSIYLFLGVDLSPPEEAAEAAAPAGYSAAS